MRIEIARVEKVCLNFEKVPIRLDKLDSYGKMEIMNKQQMIDDIAALVANSEVSDAAAEKLLPIMYSLEAELEEGEKPMGN